MIPEIRQLNEPETDCVKELLAMGVGARTIQDKLQEKFNKKVLTKDIHALRQKQQDPTSDTLATALQILHEKGIKIEFFYFYKKNSFCSAAA